MHKPAVAGTSFLFTDRGTHTKLFVEPTPLHTKPTPLHTMLSLPLTPVQDATAADAAANAAADASAAAAADAAANAAADAASANAAERTPFHGQAHNS
jgi:hypothetical protein